MRRVLVDLNVLLDVLLERQGFAGKITVFVRLHK